MIAQYNGVSFGHRYTDTVRYDKSLIYTPDNVDVLCVQHTWAIRGIVAAGTVGGLITLDLSPSQVEDLLWRKLSVPRRAFKWFDGDGSIAYQVPFENVVGGVQTPATLSGEDLAVDDMGGPYPQNISVKRIDKESWMVEFEIVSYRHPCRDESGGAQNAVLAHRWESTTEQDDLQYSTRTVNGRIWLSQAFEIEPDSDTIRQIITPPIPGGFRRTSARVSVLGDKSLTYSFRDEEQYLQLDPTWKAEAQYRLVMQTAIRSRQVFECSVEAPKYEQKSKLMLAMARLAVQYIGREQLTSLSLVKAGQISTDLFRNRVGCTFEADAACDVKGGVSGSSLFKWRMNQFLQLPEGVDEAREEEIPGRGSWVASVFHNRFRADKCELVYYNQPGYFTGSGSVPVDQGELVYDTPDLGASGSGKADSGLSWWDYISLANPIASIGTIVKIGSEAAQTSLNVDASLINSDCEGPYKETKIHTRWNYIVPTFNTVQFSSSSSTASVQGDRAESNPIQLSGGSWMKTVTIMTHRDNFAPKMPDPDSDVLSEGGRLVLVKTGLDSAEINITGVGVEWKAQAQYVYALSKKPDVFRMSRPGEANSYYESLQTLNFDDLYSEDLV